ncbi:MAG: SDR family NAD(P)-dependent oxidoreductase [Gaiellaceae bacterium]
MNERRPYVLITGGAGFVGTNLAARFVEEGRRVLVFDSLVRPGVERNLRWLKAECGHRLDHVLADVRDRDALRAAVRGAEAVFHLAAQVAVTTSLEAPLEDFDVNAHATLLLLEELRRLPKPPPLLYTSTNKVYGTLPDVRLVREAERWQPVDRRLGDDGIGEDRPLDFCTPYGCSKGASDQYVLDYAHVYGLPTVVFRMSCIYGPHQHGNEDQGWVAHFLRAARAGEPVTVYGDGGQVRDILYVDDLIDAMVLAEVDIDRIAGTAFNVGGGQTKTVSLLELIQIIGELEEKPLEPTFAAEREGDQRWYVSDTSRLRRATGWDPAVGVEEGVAALHEWVLGAARGLSAARAR